MGLWHHFTLLSPSARGGFYVQSASEATSSATLLPKTRRAFPASYWVNDLFEWMAWSLPALVLCKASVNEIIKKTGIWEEGIHLTALKCDVSNETFKSGKQSRYSEVLQAVFHSFCQKSLRREGFQSLHSFENIHKCNKEIFLSKRTSRKTQGILVGG